MAPAHMEHRICRWGVGSWFIIKPFASDGETYAPHLSEQECTECIFASSAMASAGMTDPAGELQFCDVLPYVTTDKR